jgi:hypothetical protein
MTSYSGAMAKRQALTLSDDTHAQVKAHAEEAGMSVHAWLVAAVEREAFRQLCEKQARWNAEHAETVSAAAEDYRDRQEWRAGFEGRRDSSAA